LGSNTDFRIRFTEKENGKDLAHWFEVDALDDETDPVFERKNIEGYSKLGFR